MTFIQLVALVVHEYDPAIRFFVDILGFELVEDSPSTTTDGRPKRWVVVRRRARRRACFWLVPMASAKPPSSEISTPAVSASSCASTTSALVTSEWSPPASSSCGRRGASRTVRSRCSWISQAIGGTWSVLHLSW